MIDRIDTLSRPTTAPAAQPAAEPAGFDAALKAAQAAAARDEARRSEMASIREKGFTDWVRDTRIEKLKEELRKKVMAEMGLTEEDMARLSSAMREVLEAKIREAVEQKMEEELAKAEGGQAAPQTAAAAPMAPGKNDREGGKKVPVIAALIQAGGESLF